MYVVRTYVVRTSRARAQRARGLLHSKNPFFSVMVNVGQMMVSFIGAYLQFEIFRFLAAAAPAWWSSPSSWPKLKSALESAIFGRIHPSNTFFNSAWKVRKARFGPVKISQKKKFPTFYCLGCCCTSLTTLLAKTQISPGIRNSWPISKIWYFFQLRMKS